VSKDRARPFSRKHRRYWITITGGMILIGLINLAIGFLSYEEPSEKHEKIKFDLPTRDAGMDAPADATPTDSN
jgi:hypothetical protein